MLHAPGQLAIYPIAPLDLLGWTAGQYTRLFQQGITDALAEIRIHGSDHRGRWGIWGRSGQLACYGVSVRDGISCHGAFINVNPAMRLYAFVDTVPPETASAGEKTTMGCLVAERQGTVRMTGVRAAVIRTLATAFGSERYHLYTGHPWLPTGTAESAISNA